VAETHLQDKFCEVVLVQFLHDLSVAAHIELAHQAKLFAIPLPHLNTVFQWRNIKLKEDSNFPLLTELKVNKSEKRSGEK
jgi:hypothetical protein